MRLPRLLPVLFATAACNSTGAGAAPAATAPSAPPLAASTTAATTATIDASPAEPTTTVADPGRPAIEAARPMGVAIDRTNAALYAQLRHNQGNLVYSPASIELALAMTAVGAKGQTLAEMTTALHLASDPQKTADQAAALLASWAQSAPDTPALDVANRVWVQKSYPLAPAYVATTRDKFFAPVESLDFANASDAAHTINAWVDQRTHGKITDLVAPATVAGARVVLTNAVYFHGKWQTPFDEGRTRDGDFTTDAGHKVQAKLMTGQMKAHYADLSNAQVIDLPYHSRPTRELVLTIVLPKAGTTLAALEHGFAARSLDTWTQREGWTEVDVTLPKLKLSFKASLLDALRAMGMRAAFDPNLADFSGISTKERRGLFLSDVAHEAMIDVDEVGTEAAAATAPVARAAGARMAVAAPAVFRADHPFLFFLRDKTTGAVLFAGRVVDPTKS